jgi:hypothetical protein
MSGGIGSLTQSSLTAIMRGKYIFSGNGYNPVKATKRKIPKP